MDTITILRKELRMLVKESVREVFAQEFMKFRALLLPSVSQKEQKNIEELYGKPSRNAAKSIDVEI